MFGLRPDGRQVRDIDPIQRIIPHIMRHRHDSQNLTDYDCPCEPLDTFIKEQSALGENYNYMHIIIGGLVRTIALFPRINRFIMNGRIFQRNTIQISFVVKKGFSAEAAETTVKIDFSGLESLAEIREKINDAIRANSHMEANNSTDKLARLITFTPNFLIHFLVAAIKYLDKHGLLPGAVLKVSPFHTSAFITNLKSIKGPSIYHHLYDFGNTGMFLAMGKESKVPVVEGDQIVAGKRMPIYIVTDERFCDGFYFVNAMRNLRENYAHPEKLLERLEEVTQDVKVIDRHSFRKKNRNKDE